MVQLNEQQIQAVRHFKGPCCVIGTPGSGKTRVITERVRYLIQECGVAPTNILVITFTKAAAIEMKNRFLRDVGSEHGRVQFGTFHAIFFTILKLAYHYTADNIIRDDVRKQVLKKLIDDADIEIQDENEFLSDIESEISKVKGERINLANYYSPNCPGEKFRKIFNGYQNFLAEKRLIDFDDMLVYCYELLAQRPDIRKIWQNQYQYILIDEFQDINLIQYDVVKLLAEPNNNIFIVGDDDQSIYAFRGAKPDIMKQFIKEFHAPQYLLGINYRCDKPIVDAAAHVIANNRNRLPKTLQAFKTKGEKVDIREYGKITEENNAIRQLITDYKAQGISYSQMAVLFRTNIQAGALASKLMEYNIPFIMKERIPNIYEHWIAKDIFSYINIALGSRERSLFLRIINRPKRYVHRNAFTEPYVDIEDLYDFYEDKGWMIERIDQLKFDLKMLASLKPYAAINFIRKGICYDDYIREYADYKGIRTDDMMNILDEIQENAKSYDTYDEWFAYIRQYSEELKAQAGKSRAMQNGKEQEDAVVILTMHGAKGLEYECVFIPDANEGVTPHSKAVIDADMEEERRMFYVAMTRAKKHLHIFYLKERYNKEADISRFVEETGCVEKKKENVNINRKNNQNVKIEQQESSYNLYNKNTYNKKGYNSRKSRKPYKYGETDIRYRRPQ